MSGYVNKFLLVEWIFWNVLQWKSLAVIIQETMLLKNKTRRYLRSKKTDFLAYDAL